MIWFFERQERRLHYEVRRQTDGEGYEIIITHPDGRLEIESYSEPSDLCRRAAALQNSLLHDGWAPPGPRLRHGAVASRTA